MGLLDRILGRRLDLEAEPGAPVDRTAAADHRAVDRYEHLLRASDSATIERAHVEAFERLTPAQLDILFERLATGAEAADAPADARPQSLARSAARVEARESGSLRRLLGRRPSADPARANASDPANSGPVVDWTGAALLDTVATYAIASAVWDTWDVDGVASGWGWFDEFDL